LLPPTADVEHSGWRDIVRAAKVLAQVGKIGETRMLGNGVPVAQRLLGLRMLVLKLAKHV